MYLQTLLYWQIISFCVWLYLCLFKLGLEKRWLFLAGIFFGVAAVDSTWLIPSHITKFINIIVLIVFFCLNIRRFWPISAGCFVVGGYLCNLAVYVANGLRMPAALKKIGISSEYVLHAVQMSEKTRLNFLGDWIKTGDILISPGDILTEVGISIIIICFIARAIKTRWARVA